MTSEQIKILQDEKLTTDEQWDEFSKKVTYSENYELLPKEIIEEVQKYGFLRNRIRRAGIDDCCTTKDCTVFTRWSSRVTINGKDIFLENKCHIHFIEYWNSLKENINE